MSINETVEQTLLKILEEIVERKGPGFHKIGDITSLLKLQLGEGWINPGGIGRTMRRLGFLEARHTATGTEYRLTKAKIAEVKGAAGDHRS